MRHFGHLAEEEREALFELVPGTVRRGDPASRLALALGATLYTPATHPDLSGSLRRCAGRGVVSTVLCLEDAVADHQVPAAEANLVAALSRHAADGDRGAARADEVGPLVFVRVRDAGQVARVVDALGDDTRVLTGFVLPKVTAATAGPMLDAVARASRDAGHRLLSMPVLESPPVMHAETRAAELTALAEILRERRDDVLAVRLGTTDLAGLYGLRRPRGLTVYDVALLSHLIADVVNVLGRADGSGFVVTGPVWERFGAGGHDALVREVGLDLANGLLGKTVIHPSQAAVVHGAAVVSHEDLADARDVVALGAAGGGVGASRVGTSMNEARPHGAWARAVLARADVFGVARAGVAPADLAAAAAAAAARADRARRDRAAGRDLVGGGASR